MLEFEDELEFINEGFDESGFPCDPPDGLKL
jgi:hypothetical protein